VIDNFTWIAGDHSFKLGFSVQDVADTRTATSTQLYTFASVAGYLAAKNGVNPFAYSSFSQFFGNPDLEYDTRMLALFAQDDWRLSRNVKLLYGLRYDVYAPPDALPVAPIASSRDFARDGNNVQPRLGFVWNVTEDQRTVVRANSGLMYDQPLNAIYEQALQNDGTNARASATYSPTTAGAPAFPNVLQAGTGAQPNLAWTVDPDFRVGRSWQNNVQFERAIGQSYAVGIGFSYVQFWDLPVVTNINLINPTGRLPTAGPSSAPPSMRRRARIRATTPSTRSRRLARATTRRSRCRSRGDSRRGSSSTWPTRSARAATTRRSPAPCRSRATPVAAAT